MKSYNNWFDGLPKWLKIVFAIPCLDCTWSLYRLFKSIRKNNTLGIVLAVITFFFNVIIGIFDIVCIVLTDKIYWID